MKFIEVNPSDNTVLSPVIDGSDQFGYMDAEDRPVILTDGLDSITIEAANALGYYELIEPTDNGPVETPLHELTLVGELIDGKFVAEWALVEMELDHAKSHLVTAIHELRKEVRKRGMDYTGPVLVSGTLKDDGTVYRLEVGRDQQNDIGGIISQMQDRPAITGLAFKIDDGVYIPLPDLAATKAIRDAGFDFIQALFAKEAELTAKAMGKQKISTCLTMLDELEAAFVIPGSYSGEY